MPADRDRVARWQRTREARLSALPWLRHEVHHDRTVRFVADEILVREPGADAAHRTLLDLGHDSAGIRHDTPAAGLRRLRTTGLDVPAAVRRLRRDLPAGHEAGPNHVFLSAPVEHGGPFGPPVAADAPATKLDPYQGTSPVRVVVLDTGVWLDSPLPAACYAATQENVETVLDGDTDGELDSDVGHANFIAGVLVQGTAGAQIRIVKVLDSFGVCTEADLAAAISAVTDADVLNLSLGGYTLGDEPPVALAAALRGFLDGGDRVVVAAAGNDGVADRPFWPAAFTGELPGVLAVAAHDGTAVCEWSNTGPWVSVAAPGAQILSTYIRHSRFGSGWAAWSGTSFAAPKVVAAVVDRVATAGSVLAAAQAVRQEAQGHPIGGYPALL